MVAMETKFGSMYCAISDSRTCRILSMVIKVVPFEGANFDILLQIFFYKFWIAKFKRFP